MSGNKIRAGGAAVELSLHDRIDAGLLAAKKKLQAFADGVSAIGARIFSAGQSLVTSLSGLAFFAADMAGPLQDLSESTGISAAELTGLNYVAEQTGTSLDQLSAGLRSQAKFTAGVANGSKAAAATLKQLGIASAAWLAATPAQRLGLLADGLQRVSDDSLRASLSMAVLGKGGFELQRMLAGGAAGLQSMMGRGAQLGLVIDSADIAIADELGDSWGELVAQGKVLAFQVGRSFAESMLFVFDVLKPVAAATIEAVQANRGLILAFGAGAVVVTAVGAALLAFAGSAYIVQGALAGVGFVVAAVSAAWTALGAVKAFLIGLNATLGATVVGLSAATFLDGVAATIAAGATWLWNAALSVLASLVAVITSPLFVLVAAIVTVSGALALGVYYWAAYTQSGRQAVADITRFLGGLLQVASITFGGIFDALRAGNWSLAGEIMMAGLNVGWQIGLALLTGTWATFVASIKLMFADGLSTVVSLAQAAAQQIEAALGPMLSRLGIQPGKAGQALSAAQKAINAYKGGVGQQLAKDVAAASKPVNAAVADLARLRSQAASERAAQAERFKVRLPQIGGPGALPDIGAGASGGSLATLSGFIAPLLERSAPDVHQKRTADGVEKSNELLGQLLGEVENLGLTAE